MNKKNLEKYKKILLEKKKEILSRIDSGVETGDILTTHDGRADVADIASDEYEHSLIYKLGERESRYLAKVDNKLKEIEDGTFGICKRCGKDIQLERLDIRPVADLCIECKKKEEEEEDALAR